ncbi:manganese efflux pump MntP family protein [uncultured Ruminococcus sp.]|uniref:manganese efflux pump MntP n=1 Tax=uncultured Ruminococcus sp. TaxID=165186 RepID=UPI0026710734|nr:manganese efflux pump MntP family protein [uncultured Ruminococcus sp.]
MGIVELLLTAIALSMDAFAVSVCKGLGMRRMRYDQALVISLYFGVFQALMPLIGWLLGTSFSRYIQAFDHWIAFVLLTFLGGKMLWDVFHEKEDGEQESAERRLDHRELFMLAIATSIDALAVGIAFACLDVNIWSSISIIGVTTLVISFAGVWIGNRFGNRFQKKAEIAGGLVLILIGVKILAEHLIEHQ